MRPILNFDELRKSQLSVISNPQDLKIKKVPPMSFNPKISSSESSGVNNQVKKIETFPKIKQSYSTDNFVNEVRENNRENNGGLELTDDQKPIKKIIPIAPPKKKYANPKKRDNL